MNETALPGPADEGQPFWGELGDLNARLLAFYLPQFHPIPENDAWWGEGFTEWTNVAKAKPLYPGHQQPRVPGELGYYDLRDPAIRERQADLARSAGIEGFCYWHYWFGRGRRLLERPFQDVVESGRPDFPFCLAWANDSWTGVWHGAPGQMLMEQTYPGRDDEAAHFETVLPAFRDERHVRVEGRPVFLVYRPAELPDAEAFTAHWRQLATSAGLGGLYLIAMSYDMAHPSLRQFDAVTNFGPADYLFSLRTQPLRRRIARRLWGALGGPLRFDFHDVVEQAFGTLPREKRFLPGVLTGWDNTPRAGRRGHVFEGFSPALLRRYLGKATDLVAAYPPQHRIVFLKAWNEWAEGNYLEPDATFGRTLLDAVAAEVAPRRGAGA
ncbi:glycoside hydrolase family 99-like domain-containing protein [Falsiroseomonas sp.]|uniref:glycosyltransferase WbsX family protein n=1 Tax=Falsiroseomonas sp. TaxID=2870721 RepID=UPI0035615A52